MIQEALFRMDTVRGTSGKETFVSYVDVSGAVLDEDDVGGRPDDGRLQRRALSATNFVSYVKEDAEARSTARASRRARAGLRKLSLPAQPRADSVLRRSQSSRKGSF